MRVVGESVDERAGAGGDGVDDARAGDDGAERGVSAGETLGGHEDVGRYAVVLDGEVAAGASAAGHHFVGDGEQAVLAAKLCDLLEVSGRGDDRAERRATDGLEEERGGLAAAGVEQ